MDLGYSQGKTVYEMQYATSVILRNEVIFSLSIELKKSWFKDRSADKHDKKAIESGLKFSTVTFDSGYFSSKLVKSLKST